MTLIPAQSVPRLIQAHQDTRVPEIYGDLFWASPDMTDLARESTGALDTAVFLAESVPTPHGTLFFAAPVLVRLLGQDNTPTEVGVRAISWHSTVQDDQPVVIVSTYRDDTGGIAPLGHAQALHGQQVANQGVQPLALLITVFLLMSQPGVTEVRSEQGSSVPGRRTKGSKATPKRWKPPAVRVIRVRPGSDNADAYDLGSGRGVEWRNRWVVRGHWRKQPYPSLGEGVFKPIWIAPYVKGPDTAPLLSSPKVIALDAPEGPAS